VTCWREQGEELQFGDVRAHLTVRVGDSVIETVLTRRSPEELGLKRGDSVAAIVKATDVMISKP
jgi:molybdopterin-binding protein